jgi:outer membrane protein
LTRHSIFPIFSAGLLVVILSGCAEAPVKVGEGKIEPTLRQVTGLSENAADAAAQKAQMNLWDVYALAVKRTETLASGAENVEQAKAQNRQAIGAWLPQIYLNDTFSRQSSDYIVGPPLTTPPLDNSLSLSGAETLLGGLNQVAAIQGAGANIDLQNYNLQNQSRLLLLNTANAFYNVLALEESVQALQASQELNEKTLEVEKQWQRMGRSRTADVSNTQAQLMQILADLESDKNQLVQARETLATLANIKPDQALVSEESYATPTFSQDQAESKVEERPDVKAAISNVALADASLLQAHGEHLPTLAVQGTYYLQRDGGSSTPDWNAQLVASLPLFEGGQIIAQEDQAASKKRQAEMQLSLTHRSALDDIREAYKSLLESMGETDAYQKAEQAYEQAYQDVMHDYKLNLTTNLELLQTMTSLENTKISYIKAKYQTLYDQVWLGVATGALPKIGADKQN